MPLLIRVSDYKRHRLYEPRRGSNWLAQLQQLNRM
ncbi:hypothetical protein BK121_15000 [Paenibacillus odorifer]|uniref:Uncharacterized protein n=1 Tax=Paenibacillus odorifer TaxID=189426 RepID=A0ABX3GTX4_9BACL|nr:hypothetical protein BK121_15000 [Paenibacillus odorifer]OMC79015.1 hypothetical protein BK125_09210 [Paenibacillus odorifer]OMD37127.1 hypothetical protein BSO21_06150 [Paenibacillus odorifer]